MGVGETVACFDVVLLWLIAPRLLAVADDASALADAAIVVDDDEGEGDGEIDLLICFVGTALEAEEVELELIAEIGVSICFSKMFPVGFC